MIDEIWVKGIYRVGFILIVGLLCKIFWGNEGLIYGSLAAAFILFLFWWNTRVG